MNQWKVGDVVGLKSGGPAMTVTMVGNNAGGKPAVWVAWFNSHGEPKTDSFPPEALEATDA